MFCIAKIEQYLLTCKKLAKQTPSGGVYFLKTTNIILYTMRGKSKLSRKARLWKSKIMYA